jgi:uroporphyrin-III C-methyltransferase
MKPGKVFLVGAGPGDPELLTLKAARAISAAEVVVYDRLVGDQILGLIPQTAARIDVGKAPGLHPVPQEEINRLLIRIARRGRVVVRLKGGDPFLFGRGCEEAIAVERAGIRCEVVPGITAAQGCAAAARVPLTHRGLANSVRYITGHCRNDEPLDLDWAKLADVSMTLVVYMGLSNIDEIATELICHALPADTPAIAICQGTTPRERRVSAPLIELPRAVRAARFEGPVLFIIGRAAALSRKFHDCEQGSCADALAGVA